MATKAAREAEELAAQMQHTAELEEELEKECPTYRVGDHKMQCPNRPDGQAKVYYTGPPSDDFGE